MRLAFIWVHPLLTCLLIIMGNKVAGDNKQDDTEGVKDKTITAKNIDHKILTGNDADGQAAFILNNGQETSKIFINIAFKKYYTFVMVANKINASDTGTIFSSTLADRIFGWKNVDIFFKCHVFEISKPSAINDTYLHCFIIRCNTK